MSRRVALSQSTKWGILVGDGSGKTGARRELLYLGNVRWYTIFMYFDCLKLNGKTE